MIRHRLSLIILMGFSQFAPAVEPPQTDVLLNRRVLVLGDSITQNGQWVSFLQYYLLKHHPAGSVDMISIGLGSETASGLSEEDHPFPRPCVHSRLQPALEKVRPDVVIACYGMNDGIYHPPSPERERAFVQGIEKLVTTCQQQGVKQVILLSPGTYTGRKTVNTPPYSYKRVHADYNEVLAGYAERILAMQQERVLAVDLHTPMQRLQEKRQAVDPGFRLAGDGIHPGALGHLVMARAVLARLGMPWPDDLEAELKRVTADPLYPLVHQYRRSRSKGWLAYVGYTRGKTVQSEEVNTTEQTCRELMQQIDTLRRVE